MKKVHEDIFKWFDGSRDFDAGIELFKQVSRNTFYITNLQRSRRQHTLEYELRKAVKGIEAKAPSNSTGWGGKGPAVSKPPIQENKKTAPPDKRMSGSESAPPRLVIRDEFPFLKREDCPQELKILVADMLTSHEKYVKAHGKLFEVAHKSEDVCFEVADELVENYLTNRQIWNELEHYKKTGKLLGEHPLFEEQRKKTAAENMTEEEIKKKLKNLERQLKYRQKRLKNHRKKENVAQRKAEMKEIREEMKVLKNRKPPLTPPEGEDKKGTKTTSHQ